MIKKNTGIVNEIAYSEIPFGNENGDKIKFHFGAKFSENMASTQGLTVSQEMFLTQWSLVMETISV
jgi:hypothetical protein